MLLDEGAEGRNPFLLVLFGFGANLKDAVRQDDLKGKLLAFGRLGIDRRASRHVNDARRRRVLLRLEIGQRRGSQDKDTRLPVLMTAALFAQLPATMYVRFV